MQLTVIGAAPDKKVTLSDDVFGLPLNKPLLAQAIRTQLSNRRSANAHAKTRGEISGGGRKPWRQKGTGRARVGSSRTPLWRGGGVVFGPTSTRNFSLTMPTKMAKKAFYNALSFKVSEKRLFVVADITMEKPSTKGFMKKIDGLGITYRHILLVVGESNPNLRLSSRNTIDVETVVVNSLSTYDVLQAETLVLTESALKALQQGTSKKPTPQIAEKTAAKPKTAPSKTVAKPVAKRGAAK